VKGQSGQRYDRSAVERRVVKSVHQMDCAGTGRADTNPESTGVFGEPAGHEGRGFFVADADIGDPIPLPPQGLYDGIDAVTNNSKDVRRSPFDKRLDEDIGRVCVVGWRRRRLRGDIRFGFRQCSRPACRGSHNAHACGDLPKIPAVPMHATLLFFAGAILPILPTRCSHFGSIGAGVVMHQPRRWRKLRLL
jgi:hypothetical protein